MEVAIEPCWYRAFCCRRTCSGERLQQAIEVEAKKNDNRRKLVASGCDERHLFVYVDRRNYLAWVALVDGNVPEKGPSLPNEITHVWAVAHTRSPNEVVVWLATRGGKWHYLGVLADISLS
jgi:hypothetical protein